MNSSDADSADRSRSSAAAISVAVLLVLVASSVLVRTTSVVDPWIALVAVAVAVVAAVALVLTWGRTGTPADGETESDVWDAIPNRQYEGRHVESGGLARGEQEQALEDIQQQADELERDR